jgi:hypothetical protein
MGNHLRVSRLDRPSLIRGRVTSAIRDAHLASRPRPDRMCVTVCLPALGWLTALDVLMLITDAFFKTLRKVKAHLGPRSHRAAPFRNTRRSSSLTGSSSTKTNIIDVVKYRSGSRQETLRARDPHPHGGMESCYGVSKTKRMYTIAISVSIKRSASSYSSCTVMAGSSTTMKVPIASTAS